MATFARYAVATVFLIAAALPAQAQYESIQLVPNTPDYQEAIGTGGGGELVELPNGAGLAILYRVQTDASSNLFGPDVLFMTTSQDGQNWSTPANLDASNDHQTLQNLQAAVAPVSGEETRVLLTYFRDDGYKTRYSDDDGATWTEQSGPDFVNVAYDIAGIPNGGFAALFGRSGSQGDLLSIMTSSDGLTWSTPVDAVDGGFLCGGSLAALSDMEMVVVYFECNFGSGPAALLQVKTTDGGATWSAPVEALTAENALGSRVALTYSSDSNTIWMVHANAEDLYYTTSTDGGATWAASQQWTDNDASVGSDQVSQLVMVGSQPMALFQAIRPESATTGNFRMYYGIPGVSMDPLATDVEQVSAIVPNDIELEQNYPNPFRGSTTISFSVSEAGPTSLAVYDILGREVARVVDEALPPGTYSLELDASSLPSGTYAYRLRAGDRGVQKVLTVID